VNVLFLYKRKTTKIIKEINTPKQMMSRMIGTVLLRPSSHLQSLADETVTFSPRTLIIRSESTRNRSKWKKSELKLLN